MTEGDDDDESRDSHEWDLDEADKFELPNDVKTTTTTTTESQKLNEQKSVLNGSNKSPLIINDQSLPINLQMPITKIPAPIKPKARYVETSLDDLSFSSSSSSSSSSSNPVSNSTKKKVLVQHQQGTIIFILREKETSERQILIN